jgi:Tol biopolymer transport system component
LACDVPKNDEGLEASRLAFQRGYVYINPGDKYIYAVDLSDLETPFALTQTAGIREFALSRDARQVVYVARLPQAQGDQLFALSVQGGAERVLVPESALPKGSVVSSPAFSADGNQVAFSYSDGPGFSIGLVNMDGSGLRRLNPAQGIYLSPNFRNGQVLSVVSLEGGNMALLEVASNQGIELNRRMLPLGFPPLAPSSRLTLSPDGERVAWSATPKASGSARVFVWELNTSNVWQLTEHEGETAADTTPFWKDRTTVLWTVQKAGASHAFSAHFNETKTSGTLELEHAMNTVFGPF